MSHPKKNNSNEPSALERGRKFHDKVKAEWKTTAQGKVKPEKTIIKPDGSSGRIDIHVDAGDGLVAVVEIKSTNWEKMTDSKVRRTVSKYSKQIWDYIESQLAEKMEVSPGIVLKDLPEDSDRVKLIEQLFDEEGIPVVWESESIDESRIRHKSRDT